MKVVNSVIIIDKSYIILTIQPLNYNYILILI